jgi:hypothetical protein
MINGLRISEIQQIALKQKSHQRRLTEIESRGHSRISLMDKSLMATIKNKKHNHVYLW